MMDKMHSQRKQQAAELSRHVREMSDQKDADPVAVMIGKLMEGIVDATVNNKPGPLLSLVTHLYNESEGKAHKAPVPKWDEKLQTLGDLALGLHYLNQDSQKDAVTGKGNGQLDSSSSECTVSAATHGVCVKPVPDSEMMEPNDPVLFKVKTEPDSDTEGELPVFFGTSGSLRQESSEPLPTEAVCGTPGTSIDMQQVLNEFSSMQAAPPESPWLAVSPTAHAQSSAVKFFSASDTSHSVQDPEKGTRKDRPQKNHVCDICEKSFSSCSYMKTHRLTHTGDTSYVCDVCHKVFSQSGNLKTHKLIHTGEKNHVCELCDKAFTLAQDLKRHRLIHTGEKNHVCDVCTKAFSQAHHLRSHKLTHAGERQRNHLCTICHRAFTKGSDLKRHLLIHAGEKNHACDVCHKAFIRASDLVTHKLIHTGEKNHVCRICTKSFTQAVHLKQHQTIHTGQKNYVCDICNKAFFAARGLQLHKTLHTGEKHECDFCHKTFPRLSSLKRHMLSHTGERNHACEVCHQAFTLAQHLNRHKLTHAKKHGVVDND